MGVMWGSSNGLITVVVMTLLDWDVADGERFFGCLILISSTKLHDDTIEMAVDL